MSYTISFSLKGETSTVSYIYEVEGNNVKEITYYPDGRIMYEVDKTFDENNNILVEYRKDPNGYYGWDYRILYEYDKKNKLIERKWFGPRREEPSIVNYEYDPNGNVILEITKIGITPHSIKTIKYDNKNSVIEEKLVMADNTIVHKKNYRIKYDDRGNWVEKIFFEFDDPIFIKDRE